MKFAPLLAALSLTGASFAHADVLTATFTGKVSMQNGTTHSIADIIAGSFAFDTASRTYQSFTIDGRFLPAGNPFTSIAQMEPSQTDAIYELQTSPVATGLPLNYTFALDLSSLSAWPLSETALALLTDPNQLATNLDTVGNTMSAFPSTFSYYTGNSDGTGIRSLTANLTSINVSAVPEPATVTLLLGGAALLVARRKRARGN